uniref:Uncharacterized protein n=1 Tax=Cryptosporidium parvum TaxID=5807 RepID=F0X560_CRYPV
MFAFIVIPLLQMNCEFLGLYIRKIFMLFIWNFTSKLDR